MRVFVFAVFALSACTTAPLNSERSHPSEFESTSREPTAAALVVRPNHISRERMIEVTKSYYEYWKAKYVRASDPTKMGRGFYVRMKGVGPGVQNTVTTSEAHGYGMIIFALMSDLDGEAKRHFDGMYDLFDRNRSKINPANMSWTIASAGGQRSTSATDGDMDVAYALLLAHVKWGSKGQVDYLKQALRTIESGIKAGDFSPSGRTKLGDWDRDKWNTRASDWMPGHFRAYRKYTEDPFWDRASSTVYELIAKIQKEHSPVTGLMPDFIIGQEALPAPKNYLKEGTEGFSWNACRFPLRIALDYAHYGSSDSKRALIPILDWVIAATGGDPRRIMAGYFLNGRPQVSYSEAAFTAPLVAAAMIDRKYQAFINAGWDAISEMRSDYYNDSLTLLSLLAISGLWTKP